MSFYPKYIEFNNGQIVVFDHALAHRQVAEWVRMHFDLTPVSAGLMLFKKEGYRFWASSQTLNLDSNVKLGEKDYTWYGGEQNPSGYIMFTTCPQIGRVLQAGDNQSPLAMVTISDGYTDYTLPALSSAGLGEDAAKRKLLRFNGD